MENNKFIIWYVSDIGKEDYRVIEANDEIEAREKFKETWDALITECHEIDFEHQLIVD